MLGTGHARRPTSLDNLAQAQDTTQYEGIDDSAGRREASAPLEKHWSWRGTPRYE